MSDFQTVKNKKGHQPAPTIKYASQHQQLTDMGFDSASITKALEKTQGDLEAATIILLGDEQPQSHAPKSEEFVEKESSRSSNRAKGGADNRNHSKNSSTNHSNATTGGSSKQSKEENIKDTHHRMMATYKIAKCREPPSHDKRMCIYWHSVTDRRRNPFEYTYSCFDCPSMASTNECKDGDNCPHAHSMLEKMFHPELYKISVCQRTQRGDSCDRGILCAFAHNDLDLRIISPNATPKVTPPVDWKPTKPIPDSKQLKLILERIVTILKEVGSEGAGGTEIARKYSDRYHESMELEDENKEKYKFRDLVSLNPGVTIVPNRGGPLRYIFDENRFAAAAAAAAAASTESKSEEENKSSNSGSNDAQGLNTIRERLVEIIKSAGSEGILGSDLPKKYLELHGEKLGDVVNGESGLKMKLKDILASQSEISTKLFKLQPKYVYEGGDSKPSASATAPSSSISYSSIVGAKEPAHTAPTPAATTTTTHTSSAPAAPTPAPVAAPAPAPVAQPAPVASTPAERPTTASVVTAGKSYSSVAAKLRASAAPAAPAPAPAPAPTPAPAPSVIEQPKPVVVEVPPVNPVPSVSSAKAAVSHHEENVAAIVDDGAPSAEDPIFTEDNQSSSLDNRLNEKSSNAFNSPSSAAPEPLTYQSAFGYGSVSAVSTSDNGLVGNDNDIRKSAAEPLMGAPGLTKIHNPVNSSLDSYSSTLSTIADFHERLNLAQSQISSLQQTINKLTSDLHSKNQDFDGQTIQLRNVMQRLAEAENKTSNSDEHYKLQLKAKTDELSQKTREVSKSDEENRKLREERKGDLNQFFMNLSQIEDAINAMKCKDDTTAEKTRPEDVQELLQFRKALRTFLASLKLQLKQKFDLLTSVPKPLEIESNSISSSAAIQAPRYIPNPVNGGYDANYYALAGRTDAFASAYAAYPPQVDTGLCALPGCKNPGHFTCAGCQKVSYCGADHQRLHWGHHSLNCHN